MAGWLISLAILNDYALIRESLAAALTANSARFAIAYCGTSLDDAVAANPDVVVLDLDLRSAGPFAADCVESLVQMGTTVVLLSAEDRPAATRAALDRGALGLVTKSASVEDLVEAIRTAAAGELFLSLDVEELLGGALRTPELSPRELLALRLYTSGLKLEAVARRMGVSPHTTREYLDRVRTKYEHVGRDVRTRTDLYSHALRDGLLGHEESAAIRPARTST